MYHVCPSKSHNFLRSFQQNQEPSKIRLFIFRFNQLGALLFNPFELAAEELKVFKKFNEHHLWGIGVCSTNIEVRLWQLFELKVVGTRTVPKIKIQKFGNIPAPSNFAV